MENIVSDARASDGHLDFGMEATPTQLPVMTSNVDLLPADAKLLLVMVKIYRHRSNR